MSFPAARRSLHDAIVQKFVFGQVDGQARIPAEGIDTHTGAVTHFHVQVSEITYTNDNRTVPRSIFLKKRARAQAGLRLGPICLPRFRDTLMEPYIPANGSVVVGEVAADTRGMAVSETSQRWFFTWWHGPASALFAFYQLLKFGSSKRTRADMRLSVTPNYVSGPGRDDLWAAVLLVLLGDVDAVCNGDLQLSIGSGAAFARALAAFSNDDALAARLPLALGAASTGPEQPSARVLKRARAALVEPAPAAAAPSSAGSFVAAPPSSAAGSRAATPERAPVARVHFNIWNCVDAAVDAHLYG